MTSSHQAIFDRYIAVAEVLGDMFTPLLEVIVHDLTQPQQSIIAIYNGHITGRKIGDATSDIGLKRVKGELPDKIINYKNHTPSGDALKSSTLTIRDDEGNIIGSFCMNFKTEVFKGFSNLLAGFIGTREFEFINDSEDFFVQEPAEEIRQIFQDYLVSQGWQTHGLSTPQKEQVVQYFYDHGHFNMRGIVTELATHLGVTRATVYRYLRLATASKKDVA